jgi:ATP-dependent protease ClpP protease subunit
MTEYNASAREIAIKELVTLYSFDEVKWTLTLKGAIDPEMVAGVRLFLDLYVDYVKRAKRNEEKYVDKPTLFVVSPGGDLFCTFGIVDLMRFYEVNFGVLVDVTVFGPAFSGASLIVICGTGERSIAENSYLMIHDIWGVANSAFTATDVQKKAEYIAKLQKRYFNLYIAHSKLKLEDMTGNIRDDAYYDSTECLNLGLIDKII